MGLASQFQSSKSYPVSFRGATDLGRCECSKHMCRKRCPLPLWERAAIRSQQTRLGEGVAPSPILSVALSELPSPARGEGKSFHTAFAARPDTTLRKAGLANVS